MSSTCPDVNPGTSHTWIEAKGMYQLLNKKSKPSLDDKLLLYLKTGLDIWHATVGSSQ